MISTRVITAIDAVTATTTSNKFYVGGATRIGFLLRRANHSSGSTALSVKISMDDVSTTTPTMTACNMLISNATNTNGQTLTRVASVSSGAANGDFFVWLDPLCVVNWVEVTVTETTDGTHSAYILIEEDK